VMPPRKIKVEVDEEIDEPKEKRKVKELAEEDGSVIQTITAVPELTDYEHSQMALDTFTLVIGKRGYGKSIWIRYCLSKMYKCYKEVYIFTKTKHNYFWQQHAPDAFIYPGWDPAACQTILDEAKADFDRMLDGDKDVAACPFRLIILDDVISDNLSQDHVLQELVFAGRHYFLGIFAATQDVKGESTTR